ncbi:MAG: tRNA dimethylallyltransferase, partial [Bartonella sp.]|nr:tRNA dimethylallyltransferase [Bartonella sp.]
RQLLQVDAELSKRICAQDGQRIIRALEVYDVTGKTLSWWQKQETTSLIAKDCSEKILLVPPRQQLYESINKRLDRMVEQGVLEEVLIIKQLMLSPLLPAMKAIGLPEFIAYLDGYLSFENAIETAKTKTRRYAKRQMTWFRNQLNEEWKIIAA